MKHSLTIAVLSLVAFSVAAQDAPKRPTLSESVQSMYQGVKRNVTEAAEQMPDDQYGFKPSPDVRTFGEIVGHVANAQYNFCSVALGVPNPNKVNFETVKTKKELVEALKQSNTFCDGAYVPGAESTLDAPESFNGRPVTKGYALILNVSHDNEHYGNLVTYLRVRGMVPPSTARNKPTPAPAPTPK